MRSYHNAMQIEHGCNAKRGSVQSKVVSHTQSVTGHFALQWPEWYFALHLNCLSMAQSSYGVEDGTGVASGAARHWGQVTRYGSFAK
jgi:hypothetical protein